MKLSVPIYRLKRQAKILSRSEDIPLHQALDQVASQEGFARWSLLSAKVTATESANTVLNQLSQGDMLLVGARPGQGKTSFSLEICIEAMKIEHHGVFFTLEYNPNEFLNLFKSIGEDPSDYQNSFELEVSDNINADYIISKLRSKPQGTIVVIDYLQLLDQKRENPELEVQVKALKVFAKQHGHIIVFISQIDRSYDVSANTCPTLDDVRLPNPLDLTLFDKACFIHGGEIQVSDIN